MDQIDLLSYSFCLCLLSMPDLLHASARAWYWLYKMARTMVFRGKYFNEKGATMKAINIENLGLTIYIRAIASLPAGYHPQS